MNPVTVEDGFVIANNESLDDKNCSAGKENINSIILICISTLDETFIPFCLLLNSHSDVGLLAWYHLIQVFDAIFEDFSQDDTLFKRFASKLIRAGFLKHLWKVKLNVSSLYECEFDEVKYVCNQCLKNILNCILSKENVPDTYRRALEKGITHLDCPLDECASLLSQKCDFTDQITEVFYASSTQIAFVCLCYISALLEELVVDMNILVPHLIYFVTCHSSYFSLPSCSIVVKNLIFLLAICTCGNSSKYLKKFQTGLMEVNMIVWDILAKLISPLEVYTHHKLLLLWCFRNETYSSFSSFVLHTWLKFCAHKDIHLSRNIKTVLHLLCTNKIARETFVCLFDTSSSENSEIVFLFLKQAFELEVKFCQLVWNVSCGVTSE